MIGDKVRVVGTRVTGQRFRNWMGLGQKPVPASVLDRFGDARGWSKAQWDEFWGDSRAQTIPQNMTGGQLLSVVPASYFSTPDWTQFASELKGVQEVIRWTLYSYKAYATGGFTNLLFFDQSEGTAVAGRLDTNMTTPGQLSGNEFQVVVGISIDPIPAAADVFVTNGPSLALQQWYNVLTQGWFESKISGKEYLVIAPLTQLPPGHGFGTFNTASAAAATTINVSLVQSGLPSNEARYKLDPPFGLLPTRPFEARLRWNAVQAVTTAGRIGVNYDGWKVRAVL